MKSFIVRKIHYYTAIFWMSMSAQAGDILNDFNQFKNLFLSDSKSNALRNKNEYYCNLSEYEIDKSKEKMNIMDSEEPTDSSFASNQGAADDRESILSAIGAYLSLLNNPSHVPVPAFGKRSCVEWRDKSLDYKVAVKRSCDERSSKSYKKNLDLAS